MAVDASMRKLKIPPRFLPYMEKHRIYELFHDLGNDLAINRPSDPLTYLKQCLEQVEKYTDKRMVIFIAPPFLDKVKLAQLISAKTGCSILTRYLCSSNPIDCPFALARAAFEKLENSRKSDWILVDFPETVAEAEELINIGILPTHAFLFLYEDRQFGDEKEDEVQIKTVDTSPSLLMDYNNNLYRLRELYKSSLKIIKIRGRSIEELANACANLTMKLPLRPVPKLFRCVLIGPRGSRRRTLARLLTKQFDLVHVDMEQLINATKTADTAEGDELRYLDKNAFTYPLRIVFNLLKVRLAKEDCINRGYVMTNFPTSVEDFVLLDSVETPPNKVIFLEVDGTECQERLEDRVVNMHTGLLHSKRNNPVDPHNLTHPDDESCKVENEIKFYKEKIEAMKEYCGDTSFVIDARGPINELLERVEDVLMGPSVATKPRSDNRLEKSPSLKKTRSETSKHSQQSYQRLSRTEVVPLIESAELLRRYSDLKKNYRIRSDSSLATTEDDLIMRELNKEFKKAVIGNH